MEMDSKKGPSSFLRLIFFFQFPFPPFPQLSTLQGPPLCFFWGGGFVFFTQNLIKQLFTFKIKAQKNELTVKTVFFSLMKNSFFRFIDSLVYAVGDGERTSLRKRVLFLWYLGCVLFSLPGWLVLLEEEVHWRILIATMLTFGVASAGLVYLLQRRNPTDAFVVANLCAASAIALFCDLNAADRGLARLWPIFVVLLDLLLVLQVSQRYSLGLMTAVLIWVSLTQLESAARFGLYDLGGGFSQEEKRDRLCGCETVPCPVGPGEATVFWIVLCFVIMFNFVVTRNFAQQMWTKQTHTLCMMDSVEVLAMHIASLDVASAERLLGESELPITIHAAFERIINNLTQVRPFLPDALFDAKHTSASSPNLNTTAKDASCLLSSLSLSHTNSNLQRMSGSPSFSEVPQNFSTSLGKQPQRLPPGVSYDTESANFETCTPQVGKNYAAMVLTEIPGASQLWSATPEAMKITIRLHNRIVREYIQILGGYEVRAIGDSFAVVFHDVLSAVVFSLKLQEEFFMNKNWPVEILNTTGKPSPQVQIAVHSGEFDFDINSTTGRVDYFGENLTKAAKVGEVASTGCVTITEAAMSELYIQHTENTRAQEIRELARKRTTHRSLSQLDVMLQQRGLDGIDQVVSFVPDDEGQDMEQTRRMDSDSDESVHDRTATQPQSPDATPPVDTTPQLLPPHTEITSANQKAKASSYAIGAMMLSVAPDVVVSSDLYVLIPSYIANDTDVLNNAVMRVDEANRMHDRDPHSPGRTPANPLERRRKPSLLSPLSHSHSQSGSLLTNSTPKIIERLHPATVARIELRLFEYNSDKRRLKSSLRTTGSTPRGGASTSHPNVMTLPEVTVSPTSPDLPDSAKLTRSFDSFLLASLTCLEQTEGKVISLSGASMYVGWNTSFKCSRHLEHSFRFVHLLEEWRTTAKETCSPLNPMQPFYGGISNGNVFCGSVGSPTQRFIAVLGECLKLAEHLCLAASCVKTTCLFASLDLAYVDYHIRKCVVPLQSRELPPIPVDFPDSVFELVPSSIAASSMVKKKSRFQEHSVDFDEALIARGGGGGGGGTGGSELSVDSSVASSPKGRRGGFRSASFDG